MIPRHEIWCQVPKTSNTLPLLASSMISKKSKCFLSPTNTNTVYSELEDNIKNNVRTQNIVLCYYYLNQETKLNIVVQLNAT